MFVYLVINRGGVPLFLFPNIKEFQGVKINSVLFSGLIAAINTFSMETTGDIVGEATFGNLLTTMSLDSNNNIHVFITKKDVPIELHKQLHIEFKSLFLSILKKHEIELTPEKILDGGKELEEKLRPELEPVYRLWTKTYAQYN